MAYTILIIDDNAQHRNNLKRYLGDSYSYIEAASCKTAREHLSKGGFNLIILDRIIGDKCIIEELSHELKPYSCITILYSGNTDYQIELGLSFAQTVPKGSPPEKIIDAVNCILSPKSFPDDVRPKVLSERYNQVFKIGSSETQDLDLIATTPKMMDVLRRINLLAPSDIPVLILGESGSGKEHVANLLHQKNPKRKDKKFIAYNCAAMPPSLVESELFGYIKGAHSTAYQDKAGLFEEANNGTLFLDEIGDLPLEIQPHFLRVLQEKKFSRVGESGEKLESDFRLITATNQNLQSLVEDKLFRQDLFHRIRGSDITIPPLSEREGDIELFIEHFLRCTEKKFHSGETFYHISRYILSQLLSYHWPGNVREMKQAIEELCLLSADRDGWLQVDDFKKRLLPDSSHDKGEWSIETLIRSAVQEIRKHTEINDDVYNKCINEIKYQMIAMVYKKSGFNKEETGRRLGWGKNGAHSKQNAPLFKRADKEFGI